MPKAKPSVYSVELGRVVCKDGKPYFMVGVPGDFFSRLVEDADGKPKLMGASQEDADQLAERVAQLLTDYGEHE